MDSITFLGLSTGVLMIILLILVLTLAIKPARPRRVSRRVKDDLNSIKSHINGDEDYL